MLMRFLKDNCGEIYRCLLENEAGAWLFSHTSPAAPFYVSASEYATLQRIPMPGGWPLATPEPPKTIQQLLMDETCITDKAHRQEVARQIAQEYNTTVRRVLRLYYRYLATGKLTDRKGKSPQERKEYDWAIRTYYYSAKRFSLRAAYDMMLVQRYTDADGQLLPNAPTWSSFQHYFYRNGYHKKPDKAIARDGLAKYQHNDRPAFGSASGWQPEIGSYQMDATLADIYLVSLGMTAAGSLAGPTSIWQLIR